MRILFLMLLLPACTNQPAPGPAGPAGSALDSAVTAPLPNSPIDTDDYNRPSPEETPLDAPPQTKPRDSVRKTR